MRRRCGAQLELYRTQGCATSESSPDTRAVVNRGTRENRSPRMKRIRTNACPYVGRIRPFFSRVEVMFVLMFVFAICDFAAVQKELPPFDDHGVALQRSQRYLVPISAVGLAEVAILWRGEISIMDIRRRELPISYGYNVPRIRNRLKEHPFKHIHIA